MAKYSYITDKTHNDRKIQVESAKRDGSGKNIENNYAKQNGNYQSLTAGLSNNFDTKKVIVDESAYNFRPTASMGSVELEVGSPCKVKKIIGGTIVFNQKIPTANIHTTLTLSEDEETAGWGQQVTYLSSGVMTQMLGHKVLAFVKTTDPNKATILWGQNLAQLVNGLVGSGVQGAGIYTVTSSVVSSGGSASIYWRYFAGATAGTYEADIMLIDLTQTFGSTIADYIYSLEQAEAGSGVAWSKRYLPKDYYACNSGELVSVKTQGKKITHFNQWDEQWELGTIDGNGENASSNNTIRSKNYIPVIPNTTYYQQYLTNIKNNLFYYDADKNFISTEQVRFQNTFTTPSNAHFIRFRVDSSYGTTYNHDICINFHYDGERDGEYEPYETETYPCDDVELRGVPQLDENNNLVFDGDEYANDGSVKRKYGIVDLGTLTWTYYSVSSSDTRSPYFYATAPSNLKTEAMVTYLANVVCAKYVTTTLNNFQGNDKCIECHGGYIQIKDSSYTDAQTFKTAMSGVYLVYELATPTDENSIPFTEVQECDNWGTEEWLAPTTDTRPCEVPVGHETDYLPDLKAKVEVAPSTPNENGVYVMEHNASGNTYTLLGAWLSDNGYVKPTSISGYDSTKTQTLKNVEGTLTWVDDE